MVVGRAPAPLQGSLEPPSSPPSPEVRQPQPGGDLRENRVETRAGQHAPGPRDWAAEQERAFGQGRRRREEGGGGRRRRRRGRPPGGGAWPRCAALTRWHSDRWREPAAAATVAQPVSGLRLQASSFCPAHAPRPLPFPSKTHCGIKLLGELKSPAGQLPQLDHTLLYGSAFCLGRKE